MDSIRTLIAFVGFLALCQAQVMHLGGCPKVDPQASLDVSKYLGMWYEIKRFPTLFERGKCIRAHYSLKDNGKVEVDNRYIEKGNTTNIIGEASIPDAKMSSVLAVKFTEGAPAAQYKVVETDYTTYSLVYSCTDFGSFLSTEFAWILSRTLTLDADVLARLEQKLASFGVETSNFLVADQSGCPP